MPPPISEPTAPAAASQAGPAAPRQVDSNTLLGPRGELFIVHAQQLYRLRITAQGKLILTK